MMKAIEEMSNRLKESEQSRLNDPPNRALGYWDLVWSRWHDRHSVFDMIHGSSFDLISKDENHIEV